MLAGEQRRAGPRTLTPAERVELTTQVVQSQHREHPWLVVDVMVERQLFGVAAADVVTFVAVPLVLLAVAAVACWVPARRAARVDPAIALSAE